MANETKRKLPITSIYQKDEALWRRAKERAARRGMSLSALVEEALRRDFARLADGDYSNYIPK